MNERIAVIVSMYYEELAEEMLEAAEKKIKEEKAKVAFVFRVRGSFDVALPAKKLLQRKDVDALIALGSVVTGETAHDLIVAENAARKLIDLSTELEKPVGLGISGPKMNYEQAKNRAKDFAEGAVEAVLMNLRGLKELNKKLK